MWKKTLAVITASLLLFTLSCNNDDERKAKEQKNIVLFLAFLQHFGRTGDAENYIARAAYGLESWNIGLVTSNVKLGRHTGTTTRANPPNWITMSGSDCNAIGIPDSLKASCPFSNPSTIGFCHRRLSVTGAIFDTTLVMRQSFQDDPAYSEELKRAVFIHEVGHCLGLKHTGSVNEIMYPMLLGTIIAPSTAELAAVNEVYGGGGSTSPSSGTGDAYYDIHNLIYVRHQSFPTFYISLTIGNENLTPDPQTPGAPLGETPTETTTAIRIVDGKIECDHDH